MSEKDFFFSDEKADELVSQISALHDTVFTFGLICVVGIAVIAAAILFIALN